MPESPLSAGEYQISHSIVPSLYLSGDFVGYNVVLGRYLLFYFADVSGYGASSAFVTVLLRFMVGRVIRRHQLQEDYAALAMAPQGLVEHINSQMLATGLGKHMTLFAGSVDMANNVMRYVVGAQLPPPILVVDGEAVFLPGKGKPVGIFDDATWHVEEFEMPERSSLVLSLTCFQKPRFPIKKRPSSNSSGLGRERWKILKRPYKSIILKSRRTIFHCCC